MRRYAFCMVFHVRWDFPNHMSPNRLRSCDEGGDQSTSGEKSFSHGKPLKECSLSHTLHFNAKCIAQS